MADEQNTNWQYNSAAGTESAETVEASEADASPTQENISWTAKEFIEHDRGAGWLMMLILGTVAVAALLFLITRDFVAVAATLIVGVAAAVYSKHKPKEQVYEITFSGLRVGEKMYKYDMYRHFSVHYEGQHASINLEPIKRLVPPLTVYFPAEREEEITNAIGNYLPIEEHQASVTDRIAHKLKF